MKTVIILSWLCCDYPPGMLSESHYEAELGTSSAQRSSDRRHSAPHVIRYVSTHAWTWPEYGRTQRTLERSTVRYTSLTRPSFNPSVLPPTTTAHSGPVWQWPTGTAAGPRGTTMTSS